MLPPSPDYVSRANAIDWASFRTAYGPGRDVGRWLIDLLSEDWETAFQASHKLWCGLCHQHAYASPAAAPALPFLLEVAKKADERLLVELLDILAGFAVCSRPPGHARPAGREWVGQLRADLVAQLDWFRSLRPSPNEDVDYFAEVIVDCLDPPAATGRTPDG
jgi:hypothetical protein